MLPTLPDVVPRLLEALLLEALSDALLPLFELLELLLLELQTANIKNVCNNLCNDSVFIETTLGFCSI